MAQRSNPAAVSFEAEGTVYTLLCDMNALIDFEQEFKVKAMEVLSGELSDMSILHMRGLFWAMLREHHPDMTQRDAGRLMTHAKDKMAAAIQAAFPEPSDDDAGTTNAGKTGASQTERR